MKARFWGVRGSVPTPSPAHLRYGGNTLCVEVRTGGPETGAPEPGKGEIMIFDCGTGFRLLGNALMKEFGGRPIRAHIFLSHFHWDHVQGLRFFAPLYQPGNRIHFYSFHSFQPRGQETLRQLIRNPLYPVESKVLSSVVRFQDVHGQKAVVDGAVVTVRRLNHPHGSLGFRLDSGQQVIVYASDHEPDGKHLDASLVELAEGADLLIYDAQYTPEEYASSRRGWGHSTWQHAVDLARRARVKKLVLYHHDPDHDDAAIDEIVKQASKHFGDVTGAAEGSVVDLSGTDSCESGSPAQPFPAGAVLGDVPAGEAALSASGLPDLGVWPAGITSGRWGEQEALWTGPLSEASGEAVKELPDARHGWDQAVFFEEEVVPAEIPVDTIPLYSGEPIASPIRASPPAARPILPWAVRNLDWEKLIPERAVPDRRGCERVRMDGVAARAIVFRGEQRIPARVLDMSFGGLALDFEEHWILPGEFRAELHVPVLPGGTIRLWPIYANLNEKGMRVGCRFTTNSSRERIAGLPRSNPGWSENEPRGLGADLKARGGRTSHHPT